MKTKYFSYLNTLFLLLFLCTSCTGQTKPSEQKRTNTNTKQILDSDLQIANYVVSIFEDSHGKIWFGTMSKGVACFDPSESIKNGKTSLTYYTTSDGLPSNAVVSVAEDQEGILWFATHNGLSKYDGKSFKNYTEKDGLCHFRVSNLLIDSKGIFWIGTWGGVCQFDGEKFTNFPLPTPDVDVPPYQETEDWVSEIMEDQNGDIWISRSGYAVCKYQRSTGKFKQFTKKDGLPSNCVQSILEDKHGDIWFGSRVAEKDNPNPEERNGEGGLSKYDGERFIQFSELDGLSKNDVYSIYEDKKGGLWICATGVGLYYYDGQSFSLYNETDRMDLTKPFAVQGILEDTNGRLWLGFSGGLFYLDKGKIVNITKDGPWM